MSNVLLLARGTKPCIAAAAHALSKMPRRDGAQEKFSRSSKGATKRRTVNKESLKAAKKRGTFIASVKKKKDRVYKDAR